MPVTPATALLFKDRKFAALEWDALVTRSAALGAAAEGAAGGHVEATVAACVSNMMCLAQNLKEGACCPAADGTMLDCCGVAADVTPEWTSLLYALHAVSNRSAAWHELRELMESDTGERTKSLLGSGNSFSVMLLWTATRPTDMEPLTRTARRSNIIRLQPACLSNFACAALGMAGDCCPVVSTGKNGSDVSTFLDCCPLVNE
jgi:hypothetical protein